MLVPAHALLLALALSFAPTVERRPAPATQDADAAPETFAARLSAHPYFGRLTFEAGAECAPFVLHVQPAKQNPLSHKAQVDGLYAPWLAELGRVLRKDWAEAFPAEGPQARAHLLVLSNLPAFRNAKTYASRRPADDAIVFYASDLRALIAYHDGKVDEVPAALARAQWLEEVVWTLLRDRYQGPTPIFGERWYAEGLGVYFASQERNSKPGILRHPPASDAALRWLQNVLADSELRAALILPLADLMAVRTDDERYATLITRATKVGASIPREDWVPRLYSYQAGLWMHFLLWSHAGRYQAGTRTYLAHLLADEGGAAVLAKALRIDDTTVLDKDFSTWVDGIGAPLIADSRRKRALADEVLAKSAENRAEQAAPSAWDLSAELHPGLIPHALNLEAQLASALGRAGEGELDAALAFVQTVLVSAPEESRARLTEELARLQALQATRDAFLQSLPGDKRRLRFTVAGERVTSPVVRLENAVLYLGKNKADLASLRVAELSPADLRASFGATLKKFGPAWIGNYLDLLAGAKNWRKNLDTESDAGAALSRSGDELETLVRAGVLRARFALLGSQPLPTDEAGLDALLAEIVALGSDNGDALIARARPGLRGLANKTLEALFERRGLQAVLAGEVTRLEGGAYRIRYEFDDPSELQDFDLTRDSQRERFEEWWDLEIADDQHVATMTDGALHLRGYHCYYHLLSFVAPTVRYEVIYPNTEGGAFSNTMVVICDDRNSHYVGAFDTLDLEVINHDEHQERDVLKGADRMRYPNVSYRVELGFDGEHEASLRVNGTRVLRVAVADLREGGVFLLAYSRRALKILNFEIEGKLAKGTVTDLRKAWVASRLEESGF